MSEITTRMRQTTEPCWKCGSPLWHLNPPVQGWSYHCQTCQHLTSPRAELERQMANKTEGAVGIVSAVSCRIEMSRPEASGK